MAEAARAIHYTWDDYRQWDDDRRWEVLGGEAFAMSPAPSLRHQRILFELARQLGDHFEGQPCQVFPSPTDVKLSDADIVQPDLLVVGDPSQLKETHVEGPPALVVEILSPSTANFDRIRKMRLYARFGVKEVWLITPYPWLAEVFVLDGESYRLAGAFEKTDTLASTIFPSLCIELEKVFDYDIPPHEQVQMVKEGRPPYVPRPVGGPEARVDGPPANAAAGAHAPGPG